jgi:hypothetical protein
LAHAILRKHRVAGYHRAPADCASMNRKIIDDRAAFMQRNLDDAGLRQRAVILRIKGSG